MKKQFWFVGGPEHGKRVSLPERTYTWLVPGRDSDSVVGLPRQEVYTLRTLVFDNKVLLVFVHESMTTTQAVVALSVIAYQHFVDAFGEEPE